MVPSVQSFPSWFVLPACSTAPARTVPAGPVHRHHEPQPRRLAEYETDSQDVFYVRIDKNRKLPVTTLIRALGLSTDEQIKQFFGDSEPKINASLEKDITHNTKEGLLEVYRKLRPGEPPTVENSRHT